MDKYGMEILALVTEKGLISGYSLDMLGADLRGSGERTINEE